MKIKYKQTILGLATLVSGIATIESILDMTRMVRIHLNILQKINDPEIRKLYEECFPIVKYPTLQFFRYMAPFFFTAGFSVAFSGSLRNKKTREEEPR